VLPEKGITQNGLSTLALDQAAASSLSGTGFDTTACNLLPQRYRVSCLILTVPEALFSVVEIDQAHLARI
jgi:hypothetical protein